MFGTASSSKYTCYINSVTITTFTGPAIINTERTLNYIGRSNWPSDLYATCYIDDFRLYASTLTPAQIATIASFPVPLLWYTFDDWTSGSTVINNGTLGITNNGTLQNGASIVSQTRNSVTSNCLSLTAASSQYMFIPSFMFGGGSFSVCFWYKTPSNTTNARIFDFGSGAVLNQNLIIYLVNN
jgi:hypothetical protein